MARARTWFVLALFVLVVALAHGGAALMAWLEARLSGTGPAARAPRGVDDYRVVFTLWATVVLLTPALCFYLFSRSGARNSYWRALWIFAFLAFLVHLCWKAAAALKQPSVRRPFVACSGGLHGGGRIRTCEGRANAFTARPL